jgi:hypothetical protein
MAELPLTHSYFLSEDPEELQVIQARVDRFPVELQWANHFIKLRGSKQESL